MAAACGRKLAEPVPDDFEMMPAQGDVTLEMSVRRAGNLHRSQEVFGYNPSALLDSVCQSAETKSSERGCCHGLRP